MKTIEFIQPNPFYTKRQKSTFTSKQMVFFLLFGIAFGIILGMALNEELNRPQLANKSGELADTEIPDSTNDADNKL